ncbi:hypothetical protein Hypma_012805 [Hypsizygus marmoreus]|uniref:Uncharacterized protein n=1 Tax=Hypsizygus marmoreus TaxID=39966 RepID=A0A369JFI7_HYPMA|nr:hypothetical protein Hypma_012805 [Hypsizygus marmoreus]
MPRSCLDIVASISHVIASRVRVVGIATLLLPSFPFVCPPVKGSPHRSRCWSPFCRPSPCQHSPGAFAISHTQSRQYGIISSPTTLGAVQVLLRTHFNMPHDGFEMILYGIT